MSLLLTMCRLSCGCNHAYQAPTTIQNRFKSIVSVCVSISKWKAHWVIQDVCFCFQLKQQNIISERSQKYVPNIQRWKSISHTRGNIKISIHFASHCKHSGSDSGKHFSTYLSANAWTGRIRPSSKRRYNLQTLVDVYVCMCMCMLVYYSPRK